MDYDLIFRCVNELSSMIDCGDCNLCEGESVYLMPWELRQFKHLWGAKMVSVNGVYYLQHTDGNCQFYDRTKSCRNCLMYSNRPFCCRLYPLGIFSDHGVAKWGVYKHCPRAGEIPMVILRSFAALLEKGLGPENCLYLKIEDEVGSLAEGLKGPARFHRMNARYNSIMAVRELNASASSHGL